MMTNRLGAAAETVACASLAHADIHLVSQTRELSVTSDFPPPIGGLHQHQASSAPGFGPWSDALEVLASPRSSAAMNSDVSATSMAAAASTTSSAF